MPGPIPRGSVPQVLMGTGLTVLIMLSAWTLHNVQQLGQTAAVQQIEVAHIKSDIIQLSQNINRDMTQRYAKAAGERLEEQMSDLQVRFSRLWDAVNKLRGGAVK